jgi:recombination protein RecR
MEAKVVCKYHFEINKMNLSLLCDVNIIFAKIIFTMIFSSKLIEDAVSEFSKLPGIGKKTALRMALHLLRTDKEKVSAFTVAIDRMRNEIIFCKHCHNVSDHEVCQICANPGRNHSQICVVENIRDVIAIESTQQYSGLYHVLGGIISPLDGIGPEQLNIVTLQNRVKTQGTEELIMALSPTIEGDTTSYYIAKQLKDLPVRITTIARGISFGGELEYADEMTLAKSIAKRLPIENYVSIQAKN